MGRCSEGMFVMELLEKGWSLPIHNTSFHFLTSSQDPELWYRNGNCFVYLYKRGQSTRGPSFKLPFDALLEARCHPLISQFIVHNILDEAPTTAPIQYHEFNLLHGANPNARVELYIPPPAMGNWESSQMYYMAIRNLFAWVFRRSMVGQHLGVALVWLLNTMSQLRCPGEDNMADLLSYIDEEGYLDMRNQPIHALAILHFAEYYQCKSLYINAFTHCVGMSDRLFVVPEYQTLTTVTRKLIRQLKSEMDSKLSQAGLMLRNLLEDNLAEANTGLSSHGRAHLDRFRSFLISYFTTRLGAYPPACSDPRTFIFEPEVFRIMRVDLDGLYEFLVDKSFPSPDTAPSQARCGPCTLQTVQAFDQRNKLAPLHHPLPLLPQIAPSLPSRRISWLNKTDKLKPDQRLVAHSALMKATNKTNYTTRKSPLVAAYRKFEEDTIFWPLKADRSEKLSQADARQIRWTLIYAVYQVVRSCTQAPPECRETDGVNYHVSVNTVNLPPWRDVPSMSMVRRQSERPKSAFISMNRPTRRPSCPAQQTSHEPKPVVADYFAHKLRKKSIPSAIGSNTKTTSSSSRPVIPPRFHSLNANFRHSLQIFHSLSMPSAVSTPEPSARHTIPRAARNRRSYHEIVIEGYGNGTKNVFIGDLEPMPAVAAQTPLAVSTVPFLLVTPGEVDSHRACASNVQHPTLRSPSASSTSSGLSATSTATGASEASRVSTVSTAPSSATFYSPSTSWLFQPPMAPFPSTQEIPPNPYSEKTAPSLDVNDALGPSAEPLQRPLSASSSVYSVPSAPEEAEKQEDDDDEDDEDEKRVITPPPPALPRKNSRRKTCGLHPCPLRIKKSPATTQLHLQVFSPGSPPVEDWENLDILPLCLPRSFVSV
ncbi:hypothetical protein V8F33_010559 [Rhypophila sp. PSN 637]